LAANFKLPCSQAMSVVSLSSLKRHASADFPSELPLIHSPSPQERKRRAAAPCPSPPASSSCPATPGEWSPQWPAHRQGRWSHSESRQFSTSLFTNNFESTHLYPGDTVIVPERVDKRPLLRNLVDIATIVGQFGLGIAAIDVLK